MTPEQMQPGTIARVINKPEFNDWAGKEVTLTGKKEKEGKLNPFMENPNRLRWQVYRVDNREEGWVSPEWLEAIETPMKKYFQGLGKEKVL